MLKTPTELNENVKAIARKLKLDSKKAIFLTVQPYKEAIPLECYKNVDAYVELNGGTSQLGWRIWEWTGVLIEAESHCVWKSPEGQLVDISPIYDKEPIILFLPDDSCIYKKGKRIPNIQISLKRIQ